MARVLLYSAVPMVTKGFAVVLSSLPDFDLVAVCSSGRQLAQSILASAPDLVLIDIDEEMPVEQLFELRRQIPERARIVLWVQAITPELAYQMVKLGVRGILHKSLGVDVIVKCLQKVAEGECWLEEALTASFPTIRTVRLTRREGLLLGLVSRGFKNKEIAEAMLIAEPTVKVYLSRLFRKVGAKDRFELALFGLRNAITGQVGVFPDREAAGDGRRPPVLVVEDADRRVPARSKALVVQSIA